MSRIIIRFGEDQDVNTWEEFCDIISNLEITDPVDNVPVYYEKNSTPIRRTHDIARDWQDVNIKFKVYGTAATGDTNPRWHETTLTWSNIQQAIDNYNNEHGTNHQLDTSYLPNFYLKPTDSFSTFDITYDDETMTMLSTAITSGGGIMDSHINQGFAWKNGTPLYPVYVPFEGSMYYKGYLSFVGNKCWIEAPQPFDFIGKFNDSYMDINIPIFHTDRDTDIYNRERPNIDEYSELWDNCINFEGKKKEETDIEPHVYYYNMQLYDNDEKVVYRSWTVTTYSKVNAYKTDGIPWNIEFNVSRSTDATYSSKPSKIVIQDEDGTHTYEDVNVERLLRLTEGKYSYINYEIVDDEHRWKTNVTTNLTLWKTKDDAERNTANLLDDSEAENGGKTLSTIKIRTGYDLESTDNNSWGHDSFVKTFIVSSSDLGTIGSALWSDEDTDIFKTILKGSKISNNPIDMVVSTFYYPFNILSFVETTPRGIRLGGYATGLTRPTVTSHRIVNIGTIFIDPIFLNSLDYTNVSLTLYLPFYGFTAIDYASVINTNLGIDVSLDVTNGTMKYYVKSNGKIISDFGCNVGASIPVTGSDQASKQRENIQASMGIVGGTVGGITSLATGNVAGMVSSLTTLVNSSLDINTKPSQLISGSSSSGCSCADVLYPYLIFDVQEAIIPNNLYSQYGYCSNRIDKIGNSKGWTECIDVKLVGSMLDSEKDEILSLLNSGIIV